MWNNVSNTNISQLKLICAAFDSGDGSVDSASAVHWNNVKKFKVVVLYAKTNLFSNNFKLCIYGIY